jgi:hypothetical protein
LWTLGIVGRLGLATLPLGLIWLLYFWGTR